MRKILFALLAVVSTTSCAEIYEYKIIRVIDGDTVEFEAKFLPAPLKPSLSLRIHGVDSPEKGSRAKCEKEKVLGDAATEFTKQFIAGAKSIRVELLNWDKFGGRVLGDIIADDQSLRSSLIVNGYAREYFGKSRKSWCISE